tara:strand:- start:61 stop:969 length:909 start_codon:yes stop_codon:yes gene_type:complete
MNLSFNIKISDSNANIIILSAVVIFIAILIVTYILFMIYNKLNKNKKIKETFLNSVKNAVDCNHEDYDLCEEGKVLYNTLEDKRLAYDEWNSEYVSKRKETDGDIDENSEAYKLFVKGYGDPNPVELSSNAASSQNNSKRRQYCPKIKGDYSNCGVDCIPENIITGKDDDDDDKKQKKYFCVNKGSIISNLQEANKDYNDAKKIHNDKMAQAREKKREEVEEKELKREERRANASQSKESFINALSNTNNFSNTNTLSKQVTIEDNIRPIESKKITYLSKSNSGSKDQSNNIFSDFISIIKF